MDNCNKRLLRWQDTIDQTTVSSRFVEKLGQPTVRDNGQRVPGLNLHNPRLYLVLAAVLPFSHVITGFRNRELRAYLQRRFGLSPDEYTAAQLRYDLLKLRGKGWIRKLEGKTLYVLTPKGMTQGTALAKRNDCLHGTMHGIDSPTPAVSSPQTEVQKCYRKVRKALKQLLESLAVAAQKPKYLRTFGAENLLEALTKLVQVGQNGIPSTGFIRAFSRDVRCQGEAATAIPTNKYGHAFHLLYRAEEVHGVLGAGQRREVPAKDDAVKAATGETN